MFASLRGGLFRLSGGSLSRSSSRVCIGALLSRFLPVGALLFWIKERPVSLLQTLGCSQHGHLPAFALLKTGRVVRQGCRMVFGLWSTSLGVLWVGSEGRGGQGEKCGDVHRSKLVYPLLELIVLVLELLLLAEPLPFFERLVFAVPLLVDRVRRVRTVLSHSKRITHEQECCERVDRTEYTDVFSNPWPESPTHRLMYRQEMKLWRLDDLLLPIGLQDLWLIEVSFVRGRVQLHLEADIASFR